MTVQEAIKKNIAECKRRIFRIKDFMENSKDSNNDKCKENIFVLETTIQALEEVEQYRVLGTVEELKEAREKQPKTDWISCEERLPETGLCLATYEYEDEIVVDIMFCVGKQFYYPEDAIGTGGRSVEVIAWQPLPQPYKKEDAE